MKKVMFSVILTMFFLAGCNGQTLQIIKGDTGATGPSGSTGETGAPGQDGNDGQDGQDGANAHILVPKSRTPLLVECPNGGTATDLYLDLDDSLNWSAGDLPQSGGLVACNGSNGTNSSSAGTVEVTDLGVSGSSCLAVVGVSGFFAKRDGSDAAKLYSPIPAVPGQCKDSSDNDLSGSSQTQYSGTYPNCKKQTRTCNNQGNNCSNWGSLQSESPKVVAVAQVDCGNELARLYPEHTANGQAYSWLTSTALALVDSETDGGSGRVWIRLLKF